MPASLTVRAAVARSLAFSAVPRANGNGGRDALSTWPLLDASERELMEARASCVVLDLREMGFHVVPLRSAPAKRRKAAK